MPELLVVSQHAQSFAEILEREQLPGLSTRYVETTEQALTLCGQAEIMFGAPDRLAPLLAHSPKLKWVQSSWAGVKPLVDATGTPQFCLTGVKGIFGALMSEYVLGWLLALERGILTRASQKAWDNTPDRSLQGKHLGIMGTGSIGAHVANSASHFGLKTRGLNTQGREVAGFDRCFAHSNISEFASGLDYLVALLPDTDATNAIVNSELLARLNTGAILINAGRANCLLESDLLQALASGQLASAVLDVTREEPLPTESPLWQVDGLYITSHTSAPTSTQAIVEVFCDNYRRYSAGKALRYAVDFERGY